LPRLDLCAARLCRLIGSLLSQEPHYTPDSQTLLYLRSGQIGDRVEAPTGWFGSPQHATVEKGGKMLAAIADAIVSEAREIFGQIKRVQGGPREIKQLREAR